MLHGGDYRMMGIPTRAPTGLEGDSVDDVEGVQASKDVGVQARSSGSVEEHPRCCRHLEQQAPLSPKNQGSGRQEDLSRSRVFLDHRPTQFDVVVDAAAPRVIPHSLDLDVVEAVACRHQRFDRL